MEQQASLTVVPSLICVPQIFASSTPSWSCVFLRSFVISWWMVHHVHHRSSFFVSPPPPDAPAWYSMTGLQIHFWVDCTQTLQTKYWKGVHNFELGKKMFCFVFYANTLMLQVALYLTWELRIYFQSVSQSDLKLLVLMCWKHGTVRVCVRTDAQWTYTWRRALPDIRVLVLRTYAFASFARNDQPSQTAQPCRRL